MTEHDLKRAYVLYREIASRADAPAVAVTMRDGRTKLADLGIATAMGPEDVGTPLHRDMGVHITRGVEPWRIFAQYMGRQDGPTHGRDGNVHMADARLGLIAMVSHLPAMLPVATGAAKAIALVMPELKGKIDGLSIRVPTPDVSFTDLTVEVERATTIAEVNAAFKAISQGALEGILAYSEEELVSSDYIGNPYSCIIDSKTTNVVDGTMVKVSGWYDNEWGYASRCVDLLRFVGARL